MSLETLEVSLRGAHVNACMSISFSNKDVSVLKNIVVSSYRRIVHSLGTPWARTAGAAVMVRGGCDCAKGRLGRQHSDSRHLASRACSAQGPLMRHRPNSNIFPALNACEARPFMLGNRVRWSGFGRSRFGRLFAFLGPRQSRDSCRSRGLALLEKFVRSRRKPTWSRPPGKFAALPWCCRSVTPSGGSTRVSLVFHFQKIMAFGKRAAL